MASALRLAAVPSFKAAYLIHGDDHGRLAERRARLRALAEQEGGVSGAEVFEGEESTPEAVAAALSAMTFATGRRFIIADGTERWRDKDVERDLAPVLGSMPPETTVAFFAREEGRTKAPAALHAAVKAAGGDVSAEAAAKPWELPKWVRAQAQSLGLELDTAAAQALVAHVGERQQRLMRELETIALELGSGVTVSAEDIDERAADSAERKIWTLADLLVAGDGPGATRCYLELRAQGERPPRPLFWMTSRVRQAYDVVCRIDAGQAPAEIKRTLRMPSKAADRFIADARRADVASLRRAIEALADLEVASRGGTELDEDTAALQTIDAIAA